MDITVQEKKLGLIEGEIAAEMAAALGRIGNKLFELLSELECVKTRIASAGKAEKSEWIARHETLRGEAKLYYWFLIVQRESLGLRDHRLVADTFRIPPHIST